jgi:hypothetical protein
MHEAADGCRIPFVIARKPLVAVVLLAIAAGCAEGGVKQVDADSYFLTENYSRGLFDGARQRAVTRAGQYCFQKDRRVLVDYVLQGPTNEHGAGSAEVTFRCLSRGDPELQHGKSEATPAPR